MWSEKTSDPYIDSLSMKILLAIIIGKKREIKTEK